MNTHNVGRPVVSAFDFDGTMTRLDTLVPFLFYVVGPATFIRQSFLLLPDVSSYMLGMISNNALKEKVMARFFSGIDAELLRSKAARFAVDVLPRLVRSKAMRRYKWHKSQGHRCVLISASLDIYVEPWADSVGFDDVLSSRLEIQNGCHITGRLVGKNCFGGEKCKRLEALMGDRKRYILYAYGNGKGDEELLSMADYAYFRKMPGNC